MYLQWSGFKYWKRTLIGRLNCSLVKKEVSGLLTFTVAPSAVCVNAFWCVWHASRASRCMRPQPPGADYCCCEDLTVWGNLNVFSDALLSPFSLSHTFHPPVWTVHSSLKMTDPSLSAQKSCGKSVQIRGLFSRSLYLLSLVSQGSYFWPFIRNGKRI